MGNHNSGNTLSSKARRKPSAPATNRRKSSYVDTAVKTDAGEAGTKNGGHQDPQFMKVTQSMYELDGSLQRRRRQSTGGVLDKKRLAVSRLNSATLQEDHCANGHGSNKPTTSTSNLFSRQRSVRKSDAPGHPISAVGREIIQFCFENAHPDLGFRICNRVFDKRPDYQKFVHQLGKEKWLLMTQSLKEFLDKVVAKQRRRRQSTGGVLDKKRLAVSRLNSATLQEDHCANGHGSNKPTTSTSNLFSRQRSVRKSDAPGHPISAVGREIIQFCFENAHPDLGFRICNRVFDKRPDYQKFVHQLGKEKWLLMTQSLKEFLDKVVAKIDNLETVERLSRKYGEEHVPLKNYGFKPDFWVTLADAITVEAVILDMATHQPTDTVTAWSLFVSIVFSHIRDGYYNAMRVQRISTRRKSIKQSDSVTTTASGNSSSKPSTPTTPHPPKGPNNNSLQSALAAPPRKDSTGSNRLEAKLSAGSGGGYNYNQNDLLSPSPRHSPGSTAGSRRGSFSMLA